MCLEGEHIQKAREQWSKELGVDLTDKQWQNACILAHKCSLSTRTQETAYKLLTRWYATPDKIHKWYLQSSELCWRCQSDRGTLLHIWWTCPMIAQYWSGVNAIIKHLTETSWRLDAACCLLVTTFPTQWYRNSKHLLNAAKSLVPLFWKSTNIPSIRDWLFRIKDICDMAETIAQSNDSIERYHKPGLHGLPSGIHKNTRI